MMMGPTENMVLIDAFVQGNDEAASQLSHIGSIQTCCCQHEEAAESACVGT